VGMLTLALAWRPLRIRVSASRRFATPEG
jgi:hypothetical protein